MSQCIFSCGITFAALIALAWNGESLNFNADECLLGGGGLSRSLFYINPCLDHWKSQRSLASKLGHCTVYLISQSYLLALKATSTISDVGGVIHQHFSHTKGSGGKHGAQWIGKTSSRTLRAATKIGHGSPDGRHLSTLRRGTAPVKRPQLTTRAPGACAAASRQPLRIFRRHKNGFESNLGRKL